VDTRDLRGPIPGDVLLLNSAGKYEIRNKTLQFLRSGQRPRFTHVAFCTGLCTLIHADGHGVDIVTVDDLLSNYPGSWRAIRHVQMNIVGRQDPMIVIKQAEHYLAMPYTRRWWSFVHGRQLEGETFCSYLIQQVFTNLNVPILAKRKKPLPVHFQSLPENDSEHWIDVTSEHLFGHDVLKKRPDLKVRAVEMCGVVRDTRKITLDNNQMNELMTQYFKTMDELDKKIFGSSIPSEPITLAKMPMEYWDTKEKK